MDGIEVVPQIQSTCPQNGRFGDRRDGGHSWLCARVDRRAGCCRHQTMRLEQAGAIRVFPDIKSGKSMDRPGLAELLAYARAGDTLAVVRLDRLGWSLAELLETVKMLREREIDLLSLEERSIHPRPPANSSSTSSVPSLISSGG